MISTRSLAVLGALLVVGLAIFGYQVGRAVKLGREFDRYFTVRGLSEREVKATLVIWPMRYGATGETLAELQTSMASANGIVSAFLKDCGIQDSEISHGLPEIRDTLSARRRDDAVTLPRYQAVITLVVRSRNVDLVKSAIQKSESLLAKGLPLLNEDYGNRIQFSFDDVNAIKPEMIQEATANARQAALKFAEDSKAKVGAIRKAMQGVVDIQDRDIASPELKIVRVITTVEFFIE
ncbi:MAG: SIMPL domain-containing protein [Opitutaceae bacterium]